MSTDAILAYGYDLGNTDSGWQVQGVDEWDIWLPSWLPEALPLADDSVLDDDGQLNDKGLVKLIERRLALHHVKSVHMVPYQSTSGPRYILASWSAEAARGPAVVLPRHEYSALHHQSLLDRALEVLRLRPNQAKPEFLLASYADL